MGKEFISKNFNGIIKNDNVRAHPFYATWRREPLSQDIHYQVNNYSNGWWIDPEAVCNWKYICSRNIDGSYEMAFVLEHAYLRYYYIALMGCGLVIIAAVGYTIYKIVRKK